MNGILLALAIACGALIVIGARRLIVPSVIVTAGAWYTVAVFHGMLAGAR